jgi:hypothetical protein
MEIEMEKMREQIKNLMREKEGSQGTEHQFGNMKSRKEEQGKKQADVSDKKRKGEREGTVPEQERNGAGATAENITKESEKIGVVAERGKNWYKEGGRE